MTDKQYSLDMVRKLAPPGSKVYAVIRSVARSGMSRRIDLFVTGENGDPRWLTGHASTILGRKGRPGEGIAISGCGMDMVRDLVDELHYAVYGTSSFNDDPEKWTTVNI